MSQPKEQEETLRRRNPEYPPLTHTVVTVSSRAHSGGHLLRSVSEEIPFSQGPTFRERNPSALNQNSAEPGPLEYYKPASEAAAVSLSAIGHPALFQDPNAAHRSLHLSGGHAGTSAITLAADLEFQSRISPGLSSIHSSRQRLLVMTHNPLVLDVSSTKSDTRPQRNPMPRTASIDSAISSVSSASHPQKSNLDTKDASPEEIRSLIEGAGSPENLIQQLLKEKNVAVSQNAQLWKLVDKQRALVLGLNKDLERLTKEKDRYRKKLKEMQGPVPQLPPHVARKDSQSPVRNRSVNTAAANERHDTGTRTPDSKPQGRLESSPVDPAMMPSPLQLQQQQQSARIDQPLIRQEVGASPDERPSEKSASIPIASVVVSGSSDSSPPGPARVQQSSPSIETSGDGPVRQLPKLHTGLTSLNPPSLNLIEPSPLAEKPNKSFSGARKAPAPLNLKQSSPLAPAVKAAESAGSAIEDGEDADDSPQLGRGRRTTREEDDRERELAVLAEQEARSRSKKEKLLKAKPEDAEPIIKETQLIPPTLPFVGLPASPRHPPPAIMDRLAPPSMTLSNIQPESQDSGEVIERLLPAPLRSPGLPMSPRPGMRPIGSPLPRNPRDNSSLLAALPVSPRGGMPLSPRAPTKPIPLPPGSQLAATPFPSQSSGDSGAQAEPRSIPSADNRTMSPTDPPQIYRGLVSPAYPDLLLPPNALPSIDVKVASSRLRPSNGNSGNGVKPAEDSAVFSLSIFSRASGQELWRLEKSVTALPQLDHTLRPMCSTLPRLPERKLFNGHAPAVMDARRNSINAYFDELLDTPMDESTAKIICQFLSTDAIESENNVATKTQQALLPPGKASNVRKEGYLTKRGKNFGGWKSRYYMLEGPELRCYEAPGGQHLSTIKLLGAQIGKQSQGESPTSHPDEADENQYRHAFLVLEPKKKDSSSLMRHVLCAESDAERDDWVEALLQHVRGQPAIGSSTAAEETARGHDNNNAGIKAMNYADTVAGASPVLSATPAHRTLQDPNSTPNHSSHSQAPSSNHDQIASKSLISGPTNGTVISDAGAWGNKPATQAKEHKKRNIFHFKQRPSTDSVTSQPAGGDAQSARLIEHYNGPAVFGLPLPEAVEFCSPAGVNVNLPAVVFRCIEYLRAKKAANEEGIFRLSGSNLVIRTLKERFNTEGDVDFLADGQYYDVHAIASLFKTYLRELPSTVLTRELHLDFLHVLDLPDHASKVTAFNGLVNKLPAVNYSLLQTLSQFLLEVVQNSDQNKMSVRNIGIVFSPTLNIPAPVFSMFLTDFDSIFGDPPTQEALRKVELTVPKLLTPEDIRSPRHQMFSDLPTPAYNQTAFNSGSSTPAFPSTANGKYNMPINSADDVGLIPIQPSYDTKKSPSNSHSPKPHQNWQSFPQQQPSSDAAYGSINRMMAPENAPNARAKRRESSMLFM